ncbi:MAG: hypothetical protein WC838_07395 [Candidatus Margulisiibacteriota bacterium]|jgi:hypothetical protein
MKKRLLTSVFFLFCVCSALALDIRTGEKVVVEKGAYVYDNLLLVGEVVHIKGVVVGDVIAIGSDIIIDGIIKGDLLAAGGKITFNSARVSDVRLLAKEVSFKALIRGALYAVAGDLQVLPNSYIDRALVAYGGQLKIGGRINGDVSLTGLTAEIVEGTVIKGNLTSVTSGGETRIAKEAIVVGHKNISQKKTELELIKKEFWGVVLIGQILGFLASFVFAFFLIIFAPNYIRKVNSDITQKPWRCAGFGLLNLLVTPLMALICLVSIIGIPIGVVMLFLYFIGIYSTKIFVSIWLGALILEKVNHTKKSSLLWGLALGVLVYTLLLKIPILGWIIGLAGLLVGMGALSLSKAEAIQEMKAKGII